MDTKELLVERGKMHGPYEVHADVAQRIKLTMQLSRGSKKELVWDKLTYEQRESLDMIAHKIGRILAGDPDFRDHWDDIAGYAKLVAERCSK